MRAAQLKPATVLVVDDSEEAREIFAMALSMHGFNVIEAGDGQIAMAKLCEHHVDILLTDLRMPRMDGIELATTIRQMQNHSGLPLIALTATPQIDEDLMLGLFLSVLRKPCSLDELIATVKRAAELGIAAS